MTAAIEVRRVRDRPQSEITLAEVERERAVSVLAGGAPTHGRQVNLAVLRKILEHPIELLHGWRFPALAGTHRTGGQQAIWRSGDAEAPRAAAWLVGRIEILPDADIDSQFVIGLTYQCLRDATEPGHFHLVPPRQTCFVNLRPRQPCPGGIVVLWGWTVPAEIGMAPW